MVSDSEASSPKEGVFQRLLSDGDPIWSTSTLKICWIIIILAHDATLQGQIDFYPKKIDGWKRKGDDPRTRWLFCNDLKEAQRDDE